MSDRLPPLNALRAFVSAARYLSFTKAADELGVTPAAVSHQVKSLEDIVGAPLFIRLTRALRLTERGQAALPVLSEGFELLRAGSALLSAETEQNVLTVTIPPSLAGQWLLPRLAKFQALYPLIKVRLDASMDVVDLRRDGVDVALRWGAGDYPGHECQRLFDEEIFPVCSPALLDGPHPLTHPRDLAHHTLLHTSSFTASAMYASWEMWLQLAGVPEINWREGPEFSVENMAVQVAKNGDGVALALTSLVRDDLASGALVRPFEQVITPDFSYYLVSPKEILGKKVVRDFWQWILTEVSEAN